MDQSCLTIPSENVTRLMLPSIYKELLQLREYDSHGSQSCIRMLSDETHKRQRLNQDSLAYVISTTDKSQPSIGQHDALKINIEDHYCSLHFPTCLTHSVITFCEMGKFVIHSLICHSVVHFSRFQMRRTFHERLASSGQGSGEMWTKHLRCCAQ